VFPRVFSGVPVVHTSGNPVIASGKSVVASGKSVVTSGGLERPVVTMLPCSGEQWSSGRLNPFNRLGCGEGRVESLKPEVFNTVQSSFLIMVLHR
jgi:hypothetical protein